MLMMLASRGRVPPTELGLAAAHDAGLLGRCETNKARLMLMVLASWGHVVLAGPADAHDAGLLGPCGAN